MDNPHLTTWQQCKRNFLTGIASGLGFFVGGTIIIAVLVRVLSYLVANIDLPYVASFVRDFLELVQKQPR